MLFAWDPGIVCLKASTTDHAPQSLPARRRRRYARYEYTRTCLMPLWRTDIGYNKWYSPIDMRYFLVKKEVIFGEEFVCGAVLDLRGVDGCKICRVRTYVHTVTEHRYTFGVLLDPALRTCHPKHGGKCSALRGVDCGPVGQAAYLGRSRLAMSILRRMVIASC